MNKILLTISFLLLLFSCNMNKNHQRFTAPSDSMSPTIDEGDIIVFDSSAKKFTYGDIISYRDTCNGAHICEDIYRIVGLPGDSVGVKNGISIINGKVSPNRFLKRNNMYQELEEVLPNGLKINILYAKPMLDKNFDYNNIKVPDNQYFVLGDYRAGSLDSRYFGPIPKEKITGKVIEVIKQ